LRRRRRTRELHAPTASRADDDVRALGMRDEPFAEAYAHRVLDRIWPAYARAFKV